MTNSIDTKLALLKNEIEGELYSDEVTRLLYATDASAYQETPLAIVIPRNVEDLGAIVRFSSETKLPLIPRTAGTSLAGQVVGNGIVVDCSKYLNRILELNTEQQWVRVEPGVVLDELNIEMKKHGLFFAPETSTANRCMIGGMVGNNSCGAHSLVYGNTRDHTLEVSGFLSDGSPVTFTDISAEEFEEKCELPSLEGALYRNIRDMLDNPHNREGIVTEFPDPILERRNTGYAIDIMLGLEPFEKNGAPFNFAKLICGSEGTLMFISEIKLNLVELPPREKGLLVVHLTSVEESLKANIVALNFKPAAIELMDDIILQCTKSSIEHKKNRFCIEGDPGALLCVEFAKNSRKEIDEACTGLIDELKTKGLGYHFPIVYGADIGKVWALRKAGLGLLSNIPGDAKPQPVIEDTAVSPLVLPEYIKEFNEVLERLELSCVFYAHIATGELHLRPVINLKTEAGVKQFREVATEIARLVKKYRGSLSGEHGDGRLRGEFIPYMIGEENYQLLIQLKRTWDPHGVFNPGKITDTPPMDSFLRTSPGQSTPEFETVLDFSETLGFVRMAEQCNGSADCRKSAIIGGTMCPSYQATRDENKTTRARANMLRNTLNSATVGRNPFTSKELYDILDLCLSCKGCKAECPSGVDMAKLKAEFLHHYYKNNSIPLRTHLIVNFSMLQNMASKVAGLYNLMAESKWLSGGLKRAIGFAAGRSLPNVHRITFRKWLKKNLKSLNEGLSQETGQVCLFVDEVTNFNDVPIGIATVKLLNKLGYRVLVYNNADSGRPLISKGFLGKARKLAQANVALFAHVVDETTPLIGIEPSAIFTFRDEYPDLLCDREQQKAKELAAHVFTIEEFLVREMNSGRISKDQFTSEKRQVLFHGHCQQKAIASTSSTQTILEFPCNYSVKEIKSGCCGMAGSFGYEKEHFDLSMKIGELVLFPAIQQAEESTLLAAPGTSCRHHIKDGTGRIARHPVELLCEALK